MVKHLGLGAGAAALALLSSGMALATPHPLDPLSPAIDLPAGFKTQ